MIRFYTYDDVAKLFKVKKSTVKFWKTTGKIKIYGYRPFKSESGKRLREAVIEESEVKRLCEAIFKRGSWYMGNQDKRLMEKVIDKKVVDGNVLDKVFDEVIDRLVNVEVNNQSSLTDSNRDNNHIEGDEIIVNLNDNQDEKVINEQYQ